MWNGLLERAGRHQFPEIELVFDGDVLPLDEDGLSFDTGHRPDHAFPRRGSAATGRLDDFTDKEHV